jgi:hypothetical protein
MLVKLKSGTSVPYTLTSIAVLSFSGVQGKDTLNVKLKSGSTVQYAISLLDVINFTNVQAVDSILIGLKTGTVRSYAVSSVSTLSFIGWDKSASISSTLSTTVDAFVLDQNYPNPFNPSTIIQYGLPKPCRVSIVISNSLGQAMETLVDEQQSSGLHEVTWNASALPSGVYFYRIHAGEYTETKAMILLK